MPSKQPANVQGNSDLCLLCQT